jgi:hypothetical protein
MWVGRENLGAPLVPAETGKPRAFVPVPHRSWKPGQRTGGPRARENQHRTDEDRLGARDSEVSPLKFLALLWRELRPDSLHGIKHPRCVRVKNT